MINTGYREHSMCRRNIHVNVQSIANYIIHYILNCLSFFLWIKINIITHSWTLRMTKLKTKTWMSEPTFNIYKWSTYMLKGPWILQICPRHLLWGRPLTGEPVLCKKWSYTSCQQMNGCSRSNPRTENVHSENQIS